MIALALLAGVVATPAAASPDLAAYVQARAAEVDGRADIAAQGYARALAAMPDNADIAQRAYRTGLEIGDDTLVDRAAVALARLGRSPVDAPLLAVAKVAAAHDREGARTAIDALGKGPFAILRPSLAAWAAFERGEDGLAGLADVKGEALTRRFAAETRALLLIATGRTDEGVAAVRTLAGEEPAGIDLKVSAAQLLAYAGKRAAARALLAGDQPTLAAVRTRLNDGVAPGLAFGASRLFTAVANELVGQPGALSIALTRAALRADPDADRARILLAGALSAGDSPRRATRVLEEVSPDSAYAASARAGQIQILADAGDDEAALAAARALAAPGNARAADVQRLGDLLIAAGQYDEAATAYERVLKHSATDDWAAWLQLGSALDQAGRWKSAKAALEKAVKLGPDQPLALNYLGYAGLEHGEDADKALALIERANQLKPNDAAIIDSLAWAYYLSGDHARAVPLLEKAAVGDPGDATIGEHLGDAYWATGRRFEARYAWRAAQLLATDAERARLTAKIAYGLAAR